MRINHKDSVEMVCSFLHTKSEFQQVDLKWYKDTDEEPFLQWVPSYGGQPQIVGEVDYVVGHRSINTTMGHMIEQMIVMERPTIDMSGEYHCKVATFYEEIISTLTFTVFGREASANTEDDDDNDISRPRCWSCPSLLHSSRPCGADL